MSGPGVAVVHYHLRRGGVTRVIGNAVRALAGSGARIVVLVGEAPAEPTEHVRTVGGLGYADRPSISGQELATSLKRAASGALGGPPDLWHVHNHSLGKNPALPEALYGLASEGEALLLQMHDFAEDGRPAEYRRLKDRLGGDGAESMSTKLYPQAPQVHYATLNRRDLDFLGAAGVDGPRRHLLANPVAGEVGLGERHSASGSSERRLFLYPTRAIRRKNLGEFLLWAALAGADEWFATTLAPENPVHYPVYRRWQAFARRLKLPVEFGLGSTTPLSFPELIAGAHRLVTTSVAEGFGLAFLEPWLFRRAVLGRDLAEITGDFTREGIDLSALYPRLGVPSSWIDERAFRDRIAAGLATTWSAYGRELRDDSVDRAFHSSVEGGRIDFARLDEPLQEAVIRRLVAARSARTEMSRERLEHEPVPSSTIGRNEEAVRRRFGLETYGKRLLKIYHEVAQAPRETPGPLRAEVLLEQFLAPERFCLLRT